eukprot:858545-Pleurochrysis_carterae.AAC.1
MALLAGGGDSRGVAAGTAHAQAQGIEAAGADTVAPLLTQQSASIPVELDGAIAADHSAAPPLTDASTAVAGKAAMDHRTKSPLHASLHALTIGETLHEDGKVWRSVLGVLDDAAAELQIGELLHSDSFSLLESMSALQMMDPQMDAGMSAAKLPPPLPVPDALGTRDFIGLLDEVRARFCTRNCCN